MNPPSFEFETVPSPLRDGVVTLTRQLLASPELAAFPDDPELRTQLLRVLTASPYAADILVRYPVMLAELLGSKRLQSTTTADAYLSLLQATPGVLLPQGFPGQWSYWVKPAEGRGGVAVASRPRRVIFESGRWLAHRLIGTRP